LPGVAGFLLEKEVRYLGALVADPPKPFAAVIGGAKVSSKIAALEHLLPALDTLVIGGGMANTFLAAQGRNMQASKVETDQFDVAKRILADADERGVNVLLPIDLVVADRFAEDAEHSTCGIDEVPEGYMALDIGP